MSELRTSLYNLSFVFKKVFFSILADLTKSHVSRWHIPAGVCACVRRKYVFSTSTLKLSDRFQWYI